MERSEFLNNLSKLTKEEINNIIKENGKKKEVSKRTVPLPFRIVINK